MNRIRVFLSVLLFVGLPVSSVLAKGFERNHLFAVGGGIAHPSFVGGSNPVGFVYNGGGTNALILATMDSASTSATTSTSSPINYAVGVTAGKSKTGGGIFVSGVYYQDSSSTTTTTSTGNTISWGVGAGIFEKLAVGISGATSLGTIGVLYNFEGKNRFGLIINNPMVTGGPTSYGVGYSFSGGKATLAIDAIYSSLTESGRGYAGLGVHVENFQMAVSYSQPFSSASSTTAIVTGTIALGIGFEISKSLHVAVSYLTTNSSAVTTTAAPATYGMALVYTF